AAVDHHAPRTVRLSGRRRHRCGDAAVFLRDAAGHQRPAGLGRAPHREVRMSRPTRFERNTATSEAPWVRALVLTLALGFFILFVLLPLLAVFFEALRRGWGPYLAAVVEPDALAALRLTVTVAAVAVP